MNELLTGATALAIVIGAALVYAPSISLGLVRSRGRGLPASLSVRMTEEWSGELDAIPDRATKLAFAIGIRLTRRKTFASVAGDAMTPEINRRPSMFSSFFGAFGGWRTVIAVPTVLLAIVAYGASFLIQPQYRATALILVIPQRVPEEYVKSTVTSRIEDRLQAISNQILSRTRLERIIKDFNLYEIDGGKLEDIVNRMRDRIDAKVERPDAFRVTFTHPDATIAMKVTDRLASLFIEESLRDREVLAEGTSQFLEAYLQEMRQRLLASGKKISDAERQGVASEEIAVMKLEYEALKASFTDLLAKREQSRMAGNLERRQIGEQFKLLDAARKPEAPFTPDRVFMTLVGAATGFVMGLVMVLSGWGRGSGRPRQEVVAQ